jgi:hypothetical protein
MELTNKNKHAFDFITPEKHTQLLNINQLLNLNKHNRVVFIYSAPKVGSTSLVSSFRIFGIDKMNIVHIHDEQMLKVLTNIDNVSINEIILFNKYCGKDVYVINIFRSPIERKISAFFEKIGSYHFNVTDETVNQYNTSRVIARFNNIFPWIANGDHFMDKYDIIIPKTFDFSNKYLLVQENGIHYISLRLKDSNEWGHILTKLFGFPIYTVKDYESTNKPIKDLYNRFKTDYKIPMYFLQNIKNDKYLNYYYSNDEINEYYNEWLNKSTNDIHFRGYTYEQYSIYENITMENSHLDIIQADHYLDEGCICKACLLKRKETAQKIIRGNVAVDRIYHIHAKTEFIQRKVNKVNKIKNIREKNFVGDMKKLIQGT